MALAEKLADDEDALAYLARRIPHEASAECSTSSAGQIFLGLAALFYLGAAFTLALTGHGVPSIFSLVGAIAAGGLVLSVLVHCFRN